MSTGSQRVGFSLSNRAKHDRLPAMISGLLLWLRADRGITLNAGNVSEWKDQSGKGNNFAQSTPTNQPPYILNAKNGHPGIGPFDTTDILTSTFSLTMPYTVVATYEGDPASGAQRVISGDGTAGNNGFLGIASTRHRYWSGAYASPDIAAVAGTYAQAQATQASGAVNTYNNGSATGTTSTTSDVIGANASIGNSPAVQPLNGTILEVIAYDRILTATELQRLWQYSQSRYAL